MRKPSNLWQIPSAGRAPGTTANDRDQFYGSDEWLKYYLGRQRAAINRRPKPEGLPEERSEIILPISDR